METKITIGIADMKMAKGEGMLVTYALGSCIGICLYEPVVEVYKSGEEKVTYVHMTSEKALEVIEKHIKGGKAIAEYTMK